MKVRGNIRGSAWVIAIAASVVLVGCGSNKPLASTPEEMPAAEMPAAEMPTEEMPAAEMPAAEMPTEEMPTEEMPTEEMPTEEMPTEEMPTPVVPMMSMEAMGVMVDSVTRASGEDADAAITFMKGDDMLADPSPVDVHAALMLPESPASSPSWSSGTMMVDDAAAPTERIVAYTNIEAATATPFHEAKGPAPYMVGSETLVPDEGTNIPTTVGASYTFSDIEATADMDERTFDGTLGGANGTFTCTMDPCTLSRGEGPTWSLSGGWHFTANDGENVDVQDTDYLAFGYWNKVAAARTSISDFVPFAYGSMPYGGNVSMLTGSAIYMGKAAGGYEYHTFDTMGEQRPSEYGHFTANVRLSAYFGGEGGMSTIDGSVDMFSTQRITGVDDLPVLSGSLGLNRVEVTGQSFEGTTMGGAWTGGFYGPSAMGALPTGVAGEFNGMLNNNAEVTGAYGATR